MKKKLLNVLLGVVILLTTTSLSWAKIEDLGLPSSPEKWINGGPYSAAALTNKTVVFYFFEED